MLFLSPDPVSGEPHLPQKRIPSGLLNPQFEQFKDISNKRNHLNYQIFPAKCFSPYCLQTKINSVRWQARRNYFNLLYLQSIYHGKTFCHLSKSLPQKRFSSGILWNLVDTDLLPRYNYAAPAKNRWGDTVYPQLPHTSAYS